MKQKSLQNSTSVEMFPGVMRKTLAFNDNLMLCYITMAKGATIPLHHHDPSQIGCVVSGWVRFVGQTEFEAQAGDSYRMDPNVEHGAEALEDTVLLEAFSPSRPEYED